MRREMLRKIPVKPLREGFMIEPVIVEIFSDYV
jgi:hypothetical protein